MNHRQKGIILLTTMAMMAIVTMLVLSLMQSVLLYIKSNQQRMLHHEVFYQMERILNQWDFVATRPSMGVLVEGKREFRYELKDLGVYPCLFIQINHHRQASHHWLITLTSMQSPRIVLAMRTAFPETLDENETKTCELSLQREIHAGMVSFKKNVLAG